MFSCNPWGQRLSSNLGVLTIQNSDNKIENICQRKEAIQFVLLKTLVILPDNATSGMTRTFTKHWSNIESIRTVVISTK